MSEKKTQKTVQSDLKEGEVNKGEVKGVQEAPDTSKASPSVSKNLPSKSLSTAELKALDYSDFSTPARMLALGEAIANSKLCPLKTPEDVALAMMTGRELGLPFVTSISQIYPIEGKPSLGTHLIRALIIKAGITFEKVENAVEIYNFAKKDKQGKVVMSSGKPIIVKQGTIEEQPDNTGKALAGYRTTYKFNRLIKRPDGTWKEMTAEGSFSTMEAGEANLLDKHNWKAYWRRMLDARAFNNGAREIGDDVISGLMSPDELGANSYINDRGEEVIEEIPYEEA